MFKQCLYLCLILLFLSIKSAVAGSFNPKEMNINLGTQQINVSSGYQYPILLPQESITTTTFKNDLLNFLNINFKLTINLEPTALSFNDNNQIYLIFTNQQYKNIGFIFDLDINNSGNWQAITTTSFEKEMKSQRSVPIRLRTRAVIYNQLPIGNTFIPYQANIATLSESGFLNGGWITGSSMNISMSAFSILSPQYTCRIYSADKNQSVMLNTISSISLLNNDEVYGGQFNIRLMDCPTQSSSINKFIPKDKIEVKMIDQSRPENNSDILNVITNNQINPTLGLKIYKQNNLPIIFGADSSNNKQLFSNDAESTMPTMNFRVYYARKPNAVNMMPGAITGTVMLTFSYQ
ncbi:fimbrial protein [Gallibacterium anatis]|uniref:fimbrial protein n=1 Tax=Gallibacterium anatis TaxID=750 RepID=UPI0039FC7EB7